MQSKAATPSFVFIVRSRRDRGAAVRLVMRKEGVQGVRRWWLWLVVPCVVLAPLGMVIKSRMAGAEWGTSGLPPALWLDDHYLNLDLTDAVATSAAVDTSPPGKVLPPRHVEDVVALRPDALQVAVVVSNGLRGYVFDGTKMVRDTRLDVALDGACAVSFTSDGAYVVVATSGGQVVFWGFDSRGFLHEVQRLSGFPGVVAMEPALGRDVWVVSKDRARYLGFDGNRWQEVTVLGLSLSEAKSASWHGGRRSLAILDGTRVRYFGWDESRFAELAAFSANVGGASAVVQHGLGYSVLQGRIVLGYGLTAQDVVRCPSLDFTLPEVGESLAGSPWGELEWAGLTRWGMRYVGWTGAQWVVDPARSVEGVSAARYAEQAEYRSVLLDAGFPVFKVRLEVEATIPPWCSVEYFVTTDGANWVPVEPGMNVEVPEGMKLGYWMRLVTSRPEHVQGPEIDRVKLLQIVYRYVPVIRGGKVRLIR